MDGLLDILQIGNLRFEFRFHESQGCSIIFTAQDVNNRRVIKAPVMENGQIKVYRNVEEATADAMQKFRQFSIVSSGS
jgi:hypothetical protein